MVRNSWVSNMKKFLIIVVTLVACLHIKVDVKIRREETIWAVDIVFICNLCSQRMVIDAQVAGLVIDCPSCGAAVEVPRASVEITEVTPVDADWITKVHKTKRDLAIEWAARKGLIVRPAGELYDKKGNYWGHGYQALSNKLFDLGLIKHNGDGFYVDKLHPLYIPRCR